ncbi:polysaccharide deacetylase family protein [Paenibacillus sp. TH7-28]
MPYTSRSTQNHSTRTARTKSERKTKWIKVTAVSLAVVSLTLSGIAVYSYLNHGKPSAVVKHSTTAVVSANLAGKNADSAVQPSEPKQEPPTPAKTTPQEATSTDAKAGNSENVKPSAVKQPKVIYLTFDDGPSKHTEEIMDILAKYQIHGTFFMIGNQLSGHEQTVKDAVEAGNYVGLHSMSHSKKKIYDSGNSDNFIKEFKQEQKLMAKITGVSPTLIRAPYGSKPEIGKQFRGDIADAGFKMWDWTVDSQDWRYSGNPQRILKEVKRQVHRDTEVILMHEKAQTVEILPEVIEYLQKKGYAFAVYKPNQHVSVNFAKDPRL